jgi:hypothetical protein
MIEVCKSRDRRAGPRRGLLGSVSALAMVGLSLVVAQPASAAAIASLTATSVPGERELVVTVHPKAADNSAATTGFDHFTVSAMVGSAIITTCSIDDADSPLACHLTPLVAGTAYKVVAKAMSAANETSLVATGTIEAAAGATTTPTLSPPANASVVATATGASGDVNVEWVANANVGGSVIDHHTATAYLGTSASQGTCATEDAATDNCTIHGLINGATYTFAVVANNANALGDSPSTDPTGVATASAAPGVGSGAVTGVVATVKESTGDAIVSWTPPADADEDTVYGIAITQGDGSAVGGTEACATPATTTFTTCANLVSGTDYRVSVVARKNGVDSAAVPADLTPKSFTTPVPQNAAVEGGDAEATVAWEAPDETGVTVAGYRVAAALSSAPTVTVATCTTTTALTCTLTDLTNGTSYDTSVMAYGTTGTLSAAAATVPAAVVPAVVPMPSPPVVTPPADTDVTSTSAVITWTAADPISGAPVAYYTATATAAAAGAGAAAADASSPSCTVAAPATTCPITGLLPGTAYTVTVVAYASPTVHSTAASTTITTDAASVPGGGGAMSGPIVTNRDGLMQMFARGGDNNLYTNVRDANGNWGQWTSLGGLIGSEPVAVLNGTGSTARLQVFVLGAADHAVWYKLQTADGTGFGAWTHVDGSRYISTISVEKNLSGTVQVFGRGADGNLYYAVQTAATDPDVWQNWVSLGGIIASEPNVVAWEDGTLEVFAVGQGDGLIWHTIQATPGDNTSWVWWAHVAPAASDNVSL